VSIKSRINRLWWWAAVVAIVALEILAVISPPLRPALILASALLAWWVALTIILQARPWGLRPSAEPMVWLLAAIWFIADAGPFLIRYPTPFDEIDLILRAVPLIVLAFALFKPDAFVRITGGPSTEWLLLRERAAMADDPAVGRDDATPEEEAAFEARLSGLDRYRNPRTAEFIDLFQEWFRMPEPTPATADAQSRWLEHFHAVEVSLYLSLRARPVWYDTYPWLDSVAAPIG
jgi:hypothetical protein